MDHIGEFMAVNMHEYPFRPMLMQPLILIHLSVCSNQNLIFLLNLGGTLYFEVSNHNVQSFYYKSCLNNTMLRIFETLFLLLIFKLV